MTHTGTSKHPTHSAFLNLPRDTFSLILIDEGHYGMKADLKWPRVTQYFCYAQVVSMTGTPKTWMDNYKILAEYTFTDGLQDGVLCGIRHWQLGMSHCLVDQEIGVEAADDSHDILIARLNELIDLPNCEVVVSSTATTPDESMRVECEQLFKSLTTVLAKPGITTETRNGIEPIHKLLEHILASRVVITVVRWWLSLAEHLRDHIVLSAAPDCRGVTFRVPFDSNDSTHVDKLLERGNTSDEATNQRRSIYKGLFREFLLRFTQDRKNSFMQAMVCGGSWGGRDKLPELKLIKQAAQEVSQELARKTSTRDSIRGKNGLRICLVHACLRKESEDNIKKYLAGEIDVIIGFDKLNVGFDSPPTKYLLNLRDFNSSDRHDKLLQDQLTMLIQLVGRVLRRPDTSKTDHHSVRTLADTQGGKDCLNRTVQFSNSKHGHVLKNTDVLYPCFIFEPDFVALKNHPLLSKYFVTNPALSQGILFDSTAIPDSTARAEKRREEEEARKEQERQEFEEVRRVAEQAAEAERKDAGKQLRKFRNNRDLNKLCCDVVYQAGGAYRTSVLGRASCVCYGDTARWCTIHS